MDDGDATQARLPGSRAFRFIQRETRNMTEAAEKLKAELAALPAEDREELAHFLFDSLEEEPDPGSDEAWIVELDRRWKEIESGKEVGIPGEEVLRRVREKYPGKSPVSDCKPNTEVEEL
jgi:putative addiction module component (TIGR02574 family)